MSAVSVGSVDVGNLIGPERRVDPPPSRHFRPGAPGSMGEVTGVTLRDAHLAARGAAEDGTPSDHGQVVAHLRLMPKGEERET